MPIAWSVNDDGRIDVVFSDPYTVAESEKTMKEVIARADLRRPLRFLIDVRGSTPPDTDFVVNATNFWQLHVREMWDARVAVVIATPKQEGMAQMSERSAASRELPFTIRVFHESAWEEALRWLHADAAE
jgi:hypothetical protein